MPFNQKIKEDVLVKSRRCCCICHRFAGRKIDVHHIKQESQGGENEITNAIALCLECHSEAGHYNPKHPIGNKYSPDELARHRDEWWDWCKKNPFEVIPGNLGVLEKQPNFILKTTKICSLGTPESKDYIIKITIGVKTSSKSIFEPLSLGLVTLSEGIWKSSAICNVNLEQNSVNTILDEYVIILRNNAKLSECKIHISYIDYKCDERIQEFRIYTGGPKGPVPLKVSFGLEKIYTVQPSEGWELGSQ